MRAAEQRGRMIRPLMAPPVRLRGARSCVYRFKVGEGLTMDVKEAKSRLDIAQHELEGCEAYLDQAFRNWREAEMARVSNKQHYRLRGLHGDDYRKKLKDAKNAALSQFDAANKKLKKAKADYDQATDAG